MTKKTIGRGFEALETRDLLAAVVFHNPLDSADVNNDGAVTIRDAAALAQRVLMSARGEGESSSGSGFQFLDANSDNLLSVADVQVVAARLFNSSVATDTLNRALTQLSSANGSVRRILDQYRGANETVQAAWDRILAAASQGNLHGQVGDLLDHLEHFKTELRQKLSEAHSSSAANASAVIDAVAAEWSRARSYLDDAVSSVLGDHLARVTPTQWLQASIPYRQTVQSIGQASHAAGQQLQSTWGNGNFAQVLTQGRNLIQHISSVVRQAQVQDLQVTVEVRLVAVNNGFFESIGVDFGANSSSSGDELPPIPRSAVNQILAAGINVASLSLQASHGQFTPYLSWGNLDFSTLNLYDFALIVDTNVYSTRTQASASSSSAALYNGEQYKVFQVVETPAS